MDKFIELVRDMHTECYETVLNKIFTNKIRVAMLSVFDVKNSVANAKEFRKQLNLTHFITLPENVPETSDADIEFMSVYDAINQHFRPEYIFAVNPVDARFAAKHFTASKVLFPERENTAEIYNAFMSNLPALKKVYDALIDEESRETFCGYWLGNVSNRLDKIHHAKNPHYMVPGFIPDRGAIVIDGGSYDGGTCLRFTERGFKVYGFEMDKNIFAHASKVAKQNKFVVENCGLGSHNYEAKYRPLNGGATHLDDDGNEVARIITLDSYVREKNLPRVDLIKLDVEGAELDVLQGAAVTISRFKPILLLSAYHKWDDFWTLFEFVKALNPEYEFALRQFSVSIEDEPFAVDEKLFRQMELLGLEPRYKNFSECVLLAR